MPSMGVRELAQDAAPDVIISEARAPLQLGWAGG